MKLSQLQYFTAVCKHLNITRAASELHVSQPAVSVAIHELEEEFGVVLFLRTAKGLILTADGEYLYSEAEKLLKSAQELANRMIARGKSESLIRLGIPPMLSTLVYPKVLSALVGNVSNVRVQASEAGSPELLNQVLARTLDAAIISGSADDAKVNSLGCQHLCSFNICLYVNREHPLAAKEAVTMEDLVDLPLASLPKGTYIHDFLEKKFLEMHLEPLILTYASQVSLIFKLVAGGTAASVLYEQVLPESDKIRCIPISGIQPVDATLIYNCGQKLSPAVERLVKTVKKSIF